MDKTIKSPTIVGSADFQEKCLEIVKAYTQEHMDKTDADAQEVKPFIVWYVKALKNHKALVSTNVPDGMYYELTYNGERHEIYFDAYKKFENRCIKL